MKSIILLLLLFISSFCTGQVKYTYYSKKELTEDLNFISEKLSNIHPLLLDAIIQDKWKKKFLKLEKSLPDSLTQNQFYIEIASLIAELEDGHSGVMMPFDQRIEYSKAGGKAFPFFVEIREGKLYNYFYCGNDSTLFNGGEELVEINGISCQKMIKNMEKVYGGESVYNKYKAVASYFRFYIWMFYDFENDYDIKFKNKNSEIHQVIIPGISGEDFRRNAKRMPQNQNILYDLKIEKERSLAILKISSFNDLKGFCSFANKAFVDIKNAKIENLIIDIRGNSGGRSVVVDSLMNFITDKKYAQYKQIETRISQDLIHRYKEKYPERMEWLSKYNIDDLAIQNPELIQAKRTELKFNGNLYLLTNQTSYSAASTFAGVFKELELGKIIGEETGGTIDYYGDFWMMKMPNSGIDFYIAPKKFVQYGGTKPQRGVIPDFTVKDKGESIINFTYELISNSPKAE